MDRTKLEKEVGRGLSIAQLAARFGCSKATVRYWLRKHGLRTQNPPRRESTRAAREARAAGDATLLQDCFRHGPTVFVRESSGYFRCKLCRVDAVTARRRRAKELLVAEAGGCCQVCGYAKYPGALQFHHIDPTEKRFAFGRRGLAMSIDGFREEMRKCVLLCANCHAEVEAGITKLPIHYGDRSGADVSSAIGCLGE